MRAVVLVDNIGNALAKGEWGLSIYIEHRDKRILLDTGASGLFVENAHKYAVPIEKVDYAVLSHGHYDHSYGMRDFFRVNPKASFYLRSDSGENCYFKKWFIRKYIGIPRGILEEERARIEPVTGDYRLMEGAWLIPHKLEGRSEIGRRENMYVKKKEGWFPDDFSHEQSLVLETDKGLVIFNSCSHAGADAVLQEVQETFPDKKMYALAGGFHIFRKSSAEVRRLAERLATYDIEKIYTGHCTGQRSYEVLKSILGDRAEQLRVGLEIQV